MTTAQVTENEAVGRPWFTCFWDEASATPFAIFLWPSEPTTALGALGWPEVLVLGRLPDEIRCDDAVRSPDPTVRAHLDRWGIERPAITADSQWDIDETEIDRPMD